MLEVVFPALSGSQQVDSMLQQFVAGLAGQGESTVLLVGDAGVPLRAAVLQEVRLLRHAAGPVHSSAPVPVENRTFTPKVGGGDSDVKTAHFIIGARFTQVKEEQNT